MHWSPDEIITDINEIIYNVYRFKVNLKRKLCNLTHNRL